jgi:DNA end-binding protein Ku
MLELATHIVETKKGHFDPKKFEDRYEGALKDLLKKKQRANKSSGSKNARPRMWSISWMLFARACRPKGLGTAAEAGTRAPSCRKESGPLQCPTRTLLGAFNAEPVAQIGYRIR